MKRAFMLVVVLLLAVPPLSAMWLLSSLVAYAGAPRFIDVVAALALFPFLPVLWEIGASRRERERAAAAAAGGSARARTRTRLPLLTRFWLRTALLSTVATAFLLVVLPQRTFAAVAVRGDWLCDGHEGAVADAGRAFFKSAARGLDLVGRATRDDPYARFHDDSTLPVPGPAQPVPVRVARNGTPPPVPVPSPAPAPTPGEPPPPQQQQQSSATHTRTMCATVAGGKSVCIDVLEHDVSDTPAPSPHDQATTATADATPATATTATTTPTATPTTAAIEREKKRDEVRGEGYTPSDWPLPNTLHPVVAAMTADDERSIDDVAHYIASRTSAGADRVRALHDWVADRIAYDGPAYLAHDIPDQRAATVFARRTAVCAGYALLLEALGTAAGEEIVFLHGWANGPNGVEGHAWNAAKVEGNWSLIDPTWDSGGITPDGGFVKAFNHSYLFAPPAFFVANHLPSRPDWQLLDTPIADADFQSAPSVTVVFFRDRLKIREPANAAQVDASRKVEIALDNPDRHTLTASVCRAVDDAPTCDGCAVFTQDRSDCPLAHTGRYRVTLFADGAYAASFDVNSR